MTETNTKKGGRYLVQIRPHATDNLIQPLHLYSRKLQGKLRQNKAVRDTIHLRVNNNHSAMTTTYTIIVRVLHPKGYFREQPL